MKEQAKIAILRWEQGLVPKGLMQLEAMPGNSTNPHTFPFPVRLVEVPGACVETVITHPSPKLLSDMIEIGKRLAQDGISAITTSCGFNAVFQKELAEALTIPVFTSSLLQVPFVQNVIGREKNVAVITANKGSLTEQHMSACGITQRENVTVFGLEEAKEWSKIFEQPEEGFDVAAVEAEILQTALRAVKEIPSIGAFVLECTDLPPFSKKIAEATGLPVFDFVSMIGYAAVAMKILPMY